MKTRSLIILFFLSINFISTAQKSSSTVNNTCKVLLNDYLDFLVDGSLNDETSLKKEIARLKECGLDDFDIQFFGRMESMSLLLRKMTKETKIEQLRFEDLLLEIEKVKATSGFQEVKKITSLSDDLASRKGDLKNWNQDIKIFQELGASKTVIAQVFEYLESHPENIKTYQEILTLLKK